MTKYRTLSILLLAPLILLCCVSRSEKPNLHYENIVYSIDMDSLKRIASTWREVNALIVDNYSIDNHVSRVLLLKERDGLYLSYDSERIKLDEYEKFVFKPKLDSLGLDIHKVEYVYGLMSKYPISRIAYVDKYDVSHIDFDSVRYFHITDTTYLADLDLHVERLDGKWYRETPSGASL